MNSFGDIAYLYTVDEYIATLDEAERGPAHQMFEASRLALALARQVQGLRDPLPEIRIRSNPTINAEAMPGRIYLNEGLVRTCAELALPASFFSAMELDEQLWVPLPAYALAFTLSHEYMHIARMHGDCERELGNSGAFILATEYDADLCATAVVYRLAQHLYGDLIEDREIRSITLFAILWFILSLPRSNTTTTHSPTAERIWSIYAKLCSLRKNRTHPADPSCEGPECREVADYLPETLNKISTLHPDLPYSSGGIFAQMINGFEEGPEKFQAASAWEKVRGTVEAILVKANK